MMIRIAAVCTCLLFGTSSAFAEVQLSFYGGVQAANPSDVSVRDDGTIPDGDFSIAWEGRSFDAPPYYGIRATKWRQDGFGYGLDFAHNKVYPQDGELPAGYDVLEMTDGLNTLTVNAYRRWDGAFGEMSPYVGGGLGLAIPHVEVTYDTSKTLGYQVTGAAATIIAGAAYPINDNWSVFGEYKGTYSANTANLDTGGTLNTNVITNAVNLGVSFNF